MTIYFMKLIGMSGQVVKHQKQSDKDHEPLVSKSIGILHG